MSQHLDRLAGPLRHQAGGDEPRHGFLKRVVVPLLMGAVILRSGPGGQGVQDGADDLGAFGGQIPADHPGPAERQRQAYRPVVEDLRPAWSLVFSRAGVLAWGLVISWPGSPPAPWS